MPFFEQDADRYRYTQIAKHENAMTGNGVDSVGTGAAHLRR
jgi:hypothetical protein